MQMRRGHISILSLCLVCLVGVACSGSNESETCGSLAGIRCAPDEYCDYTNNDCGIADGAGTCKRRPEACTDILSPRCACDGEVYSNECDAAAHGFDVSASDACQQAGD
jgi:hypothetical protein